LEKKKGERRGALSREGEKKRGEINNKKTILGASSSKRKREPRYLAKERGGGKREGRLPSLLLAGKPASQRISHQGRLEKRTRPARPRREKARARARGGTQRKGKKGRPVRLGKRKGTCFLERKEKARSSRPPQKGRRRHGSVEGGKKKKGRTPFPL